LVSLTHGANGVSKLLLQRPKKLNSLSLPMITELTEKYAGLAAAGTKCLILDGEGRALCAGGDVAEVRQGVLDGSTSPQDFFYDEYYLDYQIATLYERTGIIQVSLWDGIVMGGGVGLSVHSPIKVATEKTLFAMPETGIGLFPDVGATWALTRLKAGSAVGMLLGLTGQRLGAADCMYAGLATHYCPSERLPALEDKLRSLGPQVSDLDIVSSVVSEVAGDSKPDQEKAVLESNAAAIDRCFGSSSDAVAEEIAERLKAEGSEFADKVLKTLLSKSPLSVKISLEALKRHQSVTLREAIITEYRLAHWCMRDQPESDFCEGIRAVLVDKDNQPKWVPPTLEEVTAAQVEQFFAPFPDDHPRGELKI